MILDNILDAKHAMLEKNMQSLFPQTIQPIAARMKKQSSLFIIGEIKKASPSKGVIVDDFHPDQIAKDYENAGIDAISVLTENTYFQGSLDDISAAKQQTTRPILRKDFTMDVREIIETKNAGADMILLIVAMLDDTQLKTFYQIAYGLGLECIVEVHNAQELKRALQISPQIIGINNRNLHTFEVNLETTKQLASQIPSTISIVSESGIASHSDMEFVKQAGVDAVLIGESFMRCADISKHIAMLQHGSR